MQQALGLCIKLRLALSRSIIRFQIDGLVQERHNSIANALELRLSCTYPSKWYNKSVSKSKLLARQILFWQSYNTNLCQQTALDQQRVRSNSIKADNDVWMY